MLCKSCQQSCNSCTSFSRQLPAWSLAVMKAVGYEWLLAEKWENKVILASLINTLCLFTIKTNVYDQFEIQYRQLGGPLLVRGTLALGSLQLLKASPVKAHLVSSCSKLQDRSKAKEPLIALLIFILPSCCCTFFVLFCFTNRKDYLRVIGQLL